MDVPSDRPPNGAQGHRVLMPRAVAEAALPSLIGMPIDVAPGLTDHSVRNIGLITQGSIQGNELVVSGYFYGKQFPNEVAEIQRRKDEMGMSYEISDVDVQDVAASIWELSHLVFTGGAVLLKNSAAYTRTSLQARRDDEEEGDMATATKKDLIKDLNALIKKLDAQGEDEDKETDEQKAARLKAEEEKREEDEKARRARAMEEEEKRRLAAQDPEHEDEEQDKEMLKRLMEDIEAPEEEEALMRAVQRMYRSKRGRMDQAGMRHRDEEGGRQVNARMDKVEAAMGLLTDAVTKLGGLLTDVATTVKGLKTDVAAKGAGKDLSGANNGHGDGEKLNVRRKTFSAAEEQFNLAKYGIQGEEKYTTSQVDKILKENGVTDTTQRIGIKHSMEAQGMMQD